MLRLGGSLCLLFGRPTVVQMSSPSSHYVYITFIFNGIERARDRHPIEGRCRACSFFLGGGNLPLSLARHGRGDHMKRSIDGGAGCPTFREHLCFPSSKSRQPWGSYARLENLLGQTRLGKHTKNILESASKCTRHATRTIFNPNRS